MTRDERSRRFDVLAKMEARDQLHREPASDAELEETLITLQRQAYQLGVKDGQAIALETQHRTKVPA